GGAGNADVIYLRSYRESHRGAVVGPDDLLIRVVTRREVTQARRSLRHTPALVLQTRWRIEASVWEELHVTTQIRLARESTPPSRRIEVFRESDTEYRTIGRW